jgi:hypothetical protein
MGASAATLPRGSAHRWTGWAVAVAIAVALVLGAFSLAAVSRRTPAPANVRPGKAPTQIHPVLVPQPETPFTPVSQLHPR